MCYYVCMRDVLVYGFILFLILIGLFMWTTQVNPVFAVGNNGAVNTVSAPLSFSLAPLTAGSAAAETPALPDFDGNGVVFIDTADGTPHTPYLAFETTNHTLDIKELLFLNNGQQPCQVSASEYPCAKDIYGNDGASSDASPVPSGTAVHIVGGVDDQGIIVQSIQAMDAVPNNMVRFANTLGGNTKLSNGIFVMPLQVFDNASCTLGVGCFGNGIQRLETTISTGNSTTTTELVPGTLFIFGNSAIILLSITGTGASAVANFLVGLH